MEKDNRFKKVVIWGHPLGSHTHSYIHASFYKTFSYLGYETYWLNNNSEINDIDFDNCLFITEGQVDAKIPLSPNSYYILHNVDAKKYRDTGCKILILETHTRNNQGYIENVNKYIRYKNPEGIPHLAICWATDLLPHEIDINLARNNMNGHCFWAGTHGGGDSTFENGSTLYPFFDKVREINIPVKIIDPWSSPVSDEQNRIMVNKSFVSPSIQGKWQVENEYIPCRIFKNISYGHYGYSNSIQVKNIFDGPIIYENNTVNLFDSVIRKKNESSHISDLVSLMEEVKEKHTYINRIEMLLKYLP
jgi:hypothetical protein